MKAFNGQTPRVNVNEDLVKALRKTLEALRRDRGYLPGCPVQSAAEAALTRVGG